MVIISRAVLRAFVLAHPASEAALEEWYHHVRTVEWANGATVRQSFRTADYVGNERFVFNIKGNRYRLIASVSFTTRTVYLKFVGTHRQYDAVDAATVEFLKP
ncbi:type II toxin-antitoxin system HigB family toxin [Hymenobacter sp. BT664]|uniref:Type II toxin-antitoxin system HigB family toxin n=1 Tax=Hymenobacter montanus TaxID=2771359 RepID=A0A927BCV8_9BACT|nr:type II toxin-antitoxin system HigB family toxin [Hymenobacter montanus]MBD2767824.1 type II toxin-antitoxin system HigB family toxin [Hymenobacter montanus]